MDALLNQIKLNLDDRKIGIIGGRVPSAVLVPLAEINHELHLVYELRSPKLNWQPGEVCFPGGKFEDGETAVECAIRETQEEIGLTRSDYSILGELDYIIHFAGFPVYPVLAKLNANWQEHLNLNTEEVAEVFTIPLSHLQNTPPYSTRMQRYTKALDEIPDEYRALVEAPSRLERRPILFWPYEGKLLWGMTAWVTNWFIEWLKDL